MIVFLLVCILLVLLFVALPQVLRIVWFVGLTVAVWAFVLFALLMVQDISRHGF